MNLHAQLQPTPQDIGPTSRGHRSIVQVVGGSFEGPSIKGTVLAGGSDWALIGDNGVLDIDARITLKTSDDVLIYVSYSGIVRRGREALADRARGITPDSEQIYFRIAPRFETGSEQYRWLNSTLAMGVGHFPPGQVMYDIYEIL